MELVDSIPQYKAILKPNLGAVRGILAIESGQWISCQLLYDILCIGDCETCGYFGEYLYIITCKRPCFHCPVSKSAYLPIPRAEVTRRFGLPAKLVTPVLHIRTVPGIYSLHQKNIPGRVTVFDLESGRLPWIAFHGSEIATEQYCHR